MCFLTCMYIDSELRLCRAIIDGLEKRVYSQLLADHENQYHRDPHLLVKVQNRA